MSHYSSVTLLVKAKRWSIQPLKLLIIRLAYRFAELEGKDALWSPSSIKNTMERLQVAVCSLLIMLGLARAAAAIEFEAGIGPTVHERCHMDNCGFATLQSSVPVATVRDGTLFALSGVGWGAEYEQRQDDRDEYSFPPKSISPKKPFIWMAFCSKTRPYMFYFGEGSWQATPLRPGDDQAVFGFNESAYQDYWASCHHFFPTDEALIAKMARRLGYNLHGGWPGGDAPEQIKQPYDLLR